MSNTTKPMPDVDSGQVLKKAFNEVNATISIDGFIPGLVGRKVTLDLDTTSISDDTEIYTFYEGATLLYEITVIYTDQTREVMISAERTV